MIIYSDLRHIDAVAKEIAGFILITITISYCQPPFHFIFTYAFVHEGGGGKETYVNEAMTPPQLPNPIWIAIPTPRFMVPPTLFPFHITMIGIMGYTPHAARKVPMYWAAGTLVARRRIYPIIPVVAKPAKKLVTDFVSLNVDQEE